MVDRGYANHSAAQLRAAARQVTLQWCADDPAGSAEAAELLQALATAIAQRAADAAAPIDDRVRSVLGRRLLDLLRGALVRGWLEKNGAPDGLRCLFVAIENVREEIEPDCAQSFLARLSGPDALEVLVELAHDVRSPLTSILFLAEMLQRGQSGPVNENQRRQLGLVYGAALGLTSVASDIIELARGGDGLVERDPVAFSVTGVFEEVRSIVWPIAEEKQLDMRLVPPATDQRLGHPVALSRVLLNLTTNALKFSDRGFVEIAAREIGSDRIEFSVTDGGRGIAPAVLATLFRPIRPAARGRGKSFSQTGLGLTMCRRLVRAMESELRVETRMGAGTRFFFELALPTCPVRLKSPRGRGARREKRQPAA